MPSNYFKESCKSEKMTLKWARCIILDNCTNLLIGVVYNCCLLIDICLIYIALLTMAHVPNGV